MKKICAITLFCLAVIGMVSGGWYLIIKNMNRPKEKYETYIDRAAEYMQDGYYVEAIEALKNADRMHKDTAISVSIAECYYALGDMNEFRTWAKSIQNSTGGNERIYLDLAYSYVSEKDVYNAIKVLEEGMQTYTENTDMKKLYDAIKGSYKTYGFGYASINEYCGDYAIASDEHGEFLIKLSGEKKPNTDYEDILDFSNDECQKEIWNYDGLMMSVENDSNIEFYDQDGYLRKSPGNTYTYLGAFHNGYALVEKDNKWGYIDTSFKEVKLEYEDALNFENNLTAVKKDGKWAIMDSDFFMLTDYVYDDIIKDEYKNCSITGNIIVKTGSTYSLITSDGTELAGGFIEARAFLEKDGYAAVKTEDGWEAIDSKGNVVITTDYEELGSSGQKILTYKENGYWGYISPEDGEYTDAVFEGVRAINNNGFAAVYQNDSWVIIHFERFKNVSESLF